MVKVHPRVADQLRRGLLVRVQGQEVSSLGRFRSKRQRSHYGCMQRDGYNSKRVKSTLFASHRLVLFSFDGLNAQGEHFVDHKNRCRSDNTLHNLEYVTVKENNRRREIKVASGVTKKSKAVMGKRLEDDNWRLFESVTLAARFFETSTTSVSWCITGKLKQTKGVEFKPSPAVSFDGEIWKPVSQDYNSAQVSNIGRFRDTQGVVKVPTPRVDGYVCVRVNGVLQSLHRLIATAFNIPRLRGQDVVDHINENRSDNRLENLRWVTAQENTSSSFKNGARKRHVQKQSWPVELFCVQTNSWVAHESVNEAARALSLRPQDVSQSATKGCKAKGYEFRWLPQLPDLPGEVWTELLLPVQDFDPERRSVYET